MKTPKRLLKKIAEKLLKDWPIVTIVTLAAFLRLYRIAQMTAFRGEQGRDLLVSLNILRGNFTLLGPSTSISDVHFGPFYHYFNALFLLLSRLDPLGPVLGFSLLSLVAICLIYSAASHLGHKKAGYFASLLYAVSPRMVEYGKHIFNSNFIHSFSIISFWFLVKFSKTPNKLHLIFLSGIFAGLALQANFLFLSVFLGLALYLIFQKQPFKKQILFYFGCFMGILPYLLFELRHQFYNLKAFLLLADSGKGVAFSPISFLKRIFEGFYQALYFCLGYGYPDWLNFLVLATVIGGLGLYFLGKGKTSFVKTNIFFIFLGLLIIALYPGEMLVHYLGSIYPFIFLLMGLIFERAAETGIRYVAQLILAILVVLNLLKVNYSCSRECGMPSGWDLAGVKEAGKVISRDAYGSFNVASILDGDTRAYPYRYIIEVLGKKPLGVEEYPRAQVLYVIGRGDESRILNYPVWEISAFLPAEITQVWPIKNDISVFKLEKVNE